MQLIDDHLHTRMMTVPSHHCGHFLSYHRYPHRSHHYNRPRHQHIHCHFKGWQKDKYNHVMPKIRYLVKWRYLANWVGKI